MMLKAIKVDETPSENAVGGIFEGGTVKTKTLVDKDVGAEETKVAIVTFPPGARTKMHVHNHEQILYILRAKESWRTNRKSTWLHQGQSSSYLRGRSTGMELPKRTPSHIYTSSIRRRRPATRRPT
jgi:quercetin dioxygenase-like cupin family protein